MASANGNPSGSPPSRNMTTVLVPVIGVACIVVVVIIFAATPDSSTSAGKGGKGGLGKTTLVSGPGRHMSDGSNGGTDDPDLKPIGDEGLKYRDLEVGTGPEAPAGATVVVHYSGWFTNGQQFDSSKERNEPFTASLQPGHPRGVIPGWQQGMVGMKVGGIRKLVIPAALAYGAGGQPGIPGGATLIFEVELLGINS